MTHRQLPTLDAAAALAKGEYLLTLDDDSSLPDRATLGRLVAAMDAHPDIGMAGGSNTVPAWATPFVKRVMRQVPRRTWAPGSDIGDSDLGQPRGRGGPRALVRQPGG